MNKHVAILLGLLVLLASIPGFAYRYIVNETGQIARTLRVEFSEPVEITSFGGSFANVYPEGASTSFIFSHGVVETWSEGHWLRWSPSTAELVDYAWIEQDAAGIDLDGSLFLDPSLELAVREALDMPSGPLLAADVADLERLYAVGLGIVSLEGLQHCVSLTDLRLECRWIRLGETWTKAAFNFIVDLSPLAGLVKLETLHLTYCQVADISPLAKLTSLTRLELQGNRISDLSALSGITGLEFLGLGRNEISRLDALSSLVNLTTLDLGVNEIADLTPLTQLSSLTVLALDRNRIRNAASLAGLTELVDLCLIGNQISSVAPLQYLTRLTRLELESNELADVGPLAGLTELDHLNIRRNSLDISRGSATDRLIRELQQRGTEVWYEPQN